jgi:hypothetical protein
MERPDKEGRFGKFGGRYVPETLIYALDELVIAYNQAKDDPEYKVRHHGEANPPGRWWGVHTAAPHAWVCVSSSARWIDRANGHAVEDTPPSSPRPRQGLRMRLNTRVDTDLACTPSWVKRNER